MPTSTAELGPSFGERKQDGFKHSLSNRMVIKQPLKPVAQAGVLGNSCIREGRALMDAGCGSPGDGWQDKGSTHEKLMEMVTSVRKMICSLPLLY